MTMDERYVLMKLVVDEGDIDILDIVDILAAVAINKNNINSIINWSGTRLIFS